VSVNILSLRSLADEVCVKDLQSWLFFFLFSDKQEYPTVSAAG
jgi:hypothetical protein